MRPERRARNRQTALILVTSGSVGGMGQIALSLARTLPAQGWATRTVFADSPNREDLRAWYQGQGVEAEISGAVRDIVDPHTTRDLLALRDLVRETKPAVVNLHFGESYLSFKDVLAVRLAGGARCVATVHHPTPWSTLNKRKRTLTRLAALLTDTIVVNSRATHDVLVQAGVPARKLRCIPCGVPPPASLPDRAEARTRLGIPARAFLVASLARLVAHKGIDDLIDAVATIPDPCGELLLVVAGDGPDRPALEARAACHPERQIRLLGRIDDPALLYAAADLFVLPSRLEGFGLVYLEAAFHGVPSIGLDVGGVSEAIAHEQTGLVLPPGDQAALVAAIQRLHDDPELRHRLGEAARARAVNEFAESRMGERYARVLR